MLWQSRAAQAEIESLRRQLQAAQDRIDALEFDLLVLTNEEAELYREVGLTPECDDVVVSAARKALLGRWHPDRWPLERKQHASECFQAVQNAFERIEKARAMV